MPRARLTLKRPAANAAPVPPAQTSACARPSATARAACTIEACGIARTAAVGSGLLAIETGASTTSMPGAGAPIWPAGPNSSTRTPRAAASLAPAATSAAPKSAPLASTATTTTSALEPPSGWVRRVSPIATATHCHRPAMAGAARHWQAATRDRGRAPRARRPRVRRRSRTRGTPGEACAGCDSASTRRAPERRPCAGRGAWRCGCGTAFSWGRPSRRKATTAGPPARPAAAPRDRAFAGRGACTAARRLVVACTAARRLVVAYSRRSSRSLAQRGSGERSCA
jgi:hypothetical protein